MTPSSRNQRTPDEALIEAVTARARRKARARQRKRDGVWYGLGMFGLIGWAVAVPMLIGLALGVMIDSRTDSAHAWTLMLLIAGLGLGCWNAWHWVERQRRAIDHERNADPEEET